MTRLQCNKYKGDKVKVILVLGIRVMLLALGETMQADRQGLLNATTVKVKDIWLGNALILADQGTLHSYKEKKQENGFIHNKKNDVEQAFWLRISNLTSKPSDASSVKIEAPKELPKDFFNVFDRDLLNEIMEVQTVFNQMDAAVQQFLVDKQCLKIAKKELLLENDRLLQQIMSQEVLLTVMNSMSFLGEYVNMDGNRKESCNLEAELLKSQNAFNDLLKRHSQLEKHCISLECSIQLNQEIFKT
ncbi:hypothetical protein Tco_1503104 [Tanacetum coccineum]